MAQGTGQVQSDPLFIGLTRPPLPLGVSTLWLVLNGTINMLGLILFPSPKFIFFGITFHMLGFYLYSKEPLFLELFNTKYSKCGPRTNTTLYHGKNSYDPF